MLIAEKWKYSTLKWDAAYDDMVVVYCMIVEGKHREFCAHAIDWV
jgi:hypothetical protein